MKLEKSRIWKAACCKKSRTLYRNSFHKCSLYSAQNLSLNIFGDSHWWTSLLTRLSLSDQRTKAYLRIFNWIIMMIRFSYRGTSWCCFSYETTIHKVNLILEPSYLGFNQIIYHSSAKIQLRIILAAICWCLRYSSTIVTSFYSF